MLASATEFRRTAQGFATLACVMLLHACALAPAQTQDIASHAWPKSESGRLQIYGDRIESDLAAEESAYWLLDKSTKAMNARLAITDEATSTLDVQYFIWENDASSHMLISRLIHAADRGVRVRLLLDDLTIAAKENVVASLDKHPMIEVRTFNPWKLRPRLARVIEFLMRPGDLNHRMHNKTYIADSRFAMIGGRNIGDRYFGLYDEFVQNDLDIMAAGHIVDDVSESFDLFWNSTESYPVTDLVSRRNQRESVQELASWLHRSYLAESERLASFPLEPTQWDDYLDTLTKTYAVGMSEFEYDLPSIDDEQPDQMYAPLIDFIARARDEVVISSPYFIPDEEFFEMLVSLIARGVRVVILTNSLASNNHTIAHSAYKGWRKELLDHGIEIYEFRWDAEVVAYYGTPPVSPDWVGLHSKAAVIDNRWSFVGSPNVDPRSLVLNTEVGLFIDSEELAARLGALLKRDLLPENAWRLSQDDRGRLQWTNSDGTVQRQPARGLKHRIIEFFLNLLPIKDQT